MNMRINISDHDRQTKICEIVDANLTNEAVDCSILAALAVANGCPNNVGVNVVACLCLCLLCSPLVAIQNVNRASERTMSNSDDLL